MFVSSAIKVYKETIKLFYVLCFCSTFIGNEIKFFLSYVLINLGNLYCLSSEHVVSIENYTKAIELYPNMGDAYFNRGLVLIYLKDKEKGCIDLSRAGELGVQDAYGVIKKYCENEK